MIAIVQAASTSGSGALDATSVSQARSAYEVTVPGAQRPSLSLHVSFDFGDYVPLGPMGSVAVHRQPGLLLDLAKQELEVDGWGVRVPLAAASGIPREMGRALLRLWNGAQAKTLSPEEQATWERIVDQVDYQGLCAQCSLPRMAEGVVEERTHDSVRIRWTSDEQEVVRGDTTREFTMIDSGEVFRALVRYGRDGRVRDVSDVVPLGREDQLVERLMSEPWTGP